MADVTDLEAAFGYNPNLMRQGQRARVLQEKPSDYQNQHTDVTALLAGLLGVPPDELSGSVMDPNRQRLKEIAEPAFAASTLAQAIPAIGALAKLARFSGLSGSAGNVGRGLSKQAGAINSDLLKTFNLQVHDVAGNPLGPTLSDAQQSIINSAVPVFRRKSIADLALDKLGNVHTVQKTGASSGWKKSREARAEFEPAMFGNTDVTYGALVTDPYAALNAQLQLTFPDRGNSVISPSSILSGYGRYGFVPKDKSKLTYTLGDSLDQARGLPIVNADYPAELMGAHYDGNALSSMLKKYHEARSSEARRLGLTEKDFNTFYPRNLPDSLKVKSWDDAERVAYKNAIENEFKSFNSEFPSSFSPRAKELGLRGLPGHYVDYESMPRLIPRSFEIDKTPLSPFEDTKLDDLTKFISGSQPYDYVEVQGHSLTPHDIDRVIDYSITPSVTTEKKLKKLGIRYEPISDPSSALSQLHQAYSLENTTIDKLRAIANDLGQKRLLKELMHIKSVPDIRDHYHKGGPVHKQVGGPFIGHVAPESNLGHDQVAPGMRKGGLSQIKECSCGR